MGVTVILAIRVRPYTRNPQTINRRPYKDKNPTKEKEKQKKSSPEAHNKVLGLAVIGRFGTRNEGIAFEKIRASIPTV